MSSEKVTGIEKRDRTFPLHRSVRTGAVDLGADMAEHVRDLVSGVPKFLATNVARAVAGGGSQWGVSQENLTGVRVRPGFERQWIETSIPRSVKALDTDEPLGPSYRVGALVVRVTDFDAADWFQRLRFTERFDFGHTSDEDLRRFLHASEELVDFTIFEQGRRLTCYKGKVLASLSEDGTPRKDGLMISTLAPWLSAALPNRSEEKTEVEDLIQTASLFFYAFGLSHCKNSKLTQSSYTPSPAQRSVQKIPISDVPIRYHIVTLDASTTGASSGQGEREEGQRSLHICRGHFRTYTSDAPLFGKYTGTYWIPAHTRGSATEGVVLKDYEQGANS